MTIVGQICAMEAGGSGGTPSLSNNVPNPTAATGISQGVTPSVTPMSVSSGSNTPDTTPKSDPNGPSASPRASSAFGKTLEGAHCWPLCWYLCWHLCWQSACAVDVASQWTKSKAWQNCFVCENGLARKFSKASLLELKLDSKTR